MYANIYKASTDVSMVMLIHAILLPHEMTIARAFIRYLRLKLSHNEAEDNDIASLYNLYINICDN